MIKQAIIKVVEGEDLSSKEMEASFTEIMSGSCEPAQIASFITALRCKGETVDEIAAAAKVMRRFAETIDVRSSVDMDTDEINTEQETILDTCGTGGTGTNTFNISTAAAFVAAGCGVKVAKHGNRSASGVCGSADVLEALGVNISLSPNEAKACINSIGICFMYAPYFHKAMKYAAPIRKAIGIRTIFNILGPLSNPANATCQVLGVYDKKLTVLMAKVLARLGLRRAFVVYGFDTLDEISITGPTQISELKSRKITTYKITPEQFGFRRAKIKDIKGGDAAVNADIIMSVLSGEKSPKRDIVVLNSAYALAASGLAKNIKSALSLAEDSIDSKKALNKLLLLKEFKST
jgi:anthranilate phosphoribosyltransferase